MTSPDGAAVPDGFAPFEEGGDFVDLVGPLYVRGEGAERVFGLRVEERHRNAALALLRMSEVAESIANPI